MLRAQKVLLFPFCSSSGGQCSVPMSVLFGAIVVVEDGKKAEEKATKNEKHEGARTLLERKPWRQRCSRWSSSTVASARRSGSSWRYVKCTLPDNGQRDGRLARYRLVLGLVSISRYRPWNDRNCCRVECSWSDGFNAPYHLRRLSVALHR